MSRVIDVEALRSGIEEAIRQALKGLVEGAEEDLQTYAQGIARNLVDAAGSNDEAWREELIAQARVLGEIQRIRVVNAQHEIVHAVLRGVLQAVLATMGALREEVG